MSEIEDDRSLQLIGHVEDLKEEYYVIFAERMIQHPAVKTYVMLISVKCLSKPVSLLK